MRYQLSINSGVVVFLSTNFQRELSSRTSSDLTV